MSATDEDDHHHQIAPTPLQQRFPPPAVVEKTSGGLVLYYHPHNFFSQKILIALHEKRIPFTAHVVDILNGEQYSPWFLQLNPRGEVPVLQHGAQIVPDSARILAYLEGHFVGDDFMPLLPPGATNAALRERIVLFHRKIGLLSISAISMGAFLHPHVGAERKPPLAAVSIESMADNRRRVGEVIAALADERHPLAEVLAQRMAVGQSSSASSSSSSYQQSHDAFMHVLSIVDELLAEVEAHLGEAQQQQQPQTAGGHRWLYGDQFTVADLSLGMLLHRLSLLGLDELGWLQRQRPCIGEYFERVVRRESFRRAIEAQQNAAGGSDHAGEEETTSTATTTAEAAAAAALDLLKRVQLGMSEVSVTEVWANVTANHVAAAVTVLSAAIVLLVPLYAAACK